MSRLSPPFCLLALAPLLFSSSTLAQPPEYADHVFPADAVINVTLPPYSAIPDDGQDDTAAIQQAITDHAETGRTVYLPAGVYQVSDSLVMKNKDGHWTNCLTLKGQNRAKTILRLADGAPGFGDPDSPKYVYATGSLWQPGDSEEGGGNKAFSNNVFDLTIDTGNGNPGAIGIEWANSNQGSIRDVVVSSRDGRGATGIAMRRKIPGPGLLTGVTISGFRTGIDLGDMQYGFTMNDVSIDRYQETAIRLDGNLLHAANLSMRGKAPAITVTTNHSVLTLTGARLLSPSPPTSPPLVAKGTVYVRNAFDHDELIQPAVMGAASATSLNLPVEQTPDYFNADLADWEPIGPRREGESDDTQAIQRAIDSGKSTVYFPNTRVYFMSDTLVIRGKLRQLLGMGSELNLGAAKEPFSDRANPRPLIRIDPTEAKIVHIENFLFNAQYPGEMIFENNAPETLVIRNCLGWVGGEGMRRTYQNTDAARGGKVFIEDVFMPGWEFRGQQVWARQFNPEDADSEGSRPQVLNENSTLWILGFKTEGPAPFIVTRGPEAKTELLGAYNYVSAASPTPLPKISVPYVIEGGASADLTFVTENFRGGDDDYPVYIRDGKKDIPASDLSKRWHSVNPQSYAVPLYRARP